MKTKIITVTSTGINSEEQLVFNCGIVITSTGQYDVPSGPKSIYFINNSGEDIEFNFITSKEYLEFIANPTNFTGLLINNGGTYIQRDIIGKDSLDPQPLYLLVKGRGSSATTSLIINCLDYS